jgi:hypothetical protein
MGTNRSNSQKDIMRIPAQTLSSNIAVAGGGVEQKGRQNRYFLRKNSAQKFLS